MPKILIAEDERDIRELVGFTLRLAGHETIFAVNGQEAIKLCELEQPDLVLMDMRMPVMTGEEAALQMKESPTLSKIPILFLTAREQTIEIAGQIAQGANILAKPFSIDQLNKKVRDLLSSASA